MIAALESDVVGEGKETVSFNCGWRGWSPVKTTVQTAPTYELIVCALLLDNTVIEYNDTVNPFERGDSV